MASILPITVVAPDAKPKNRIVKMPKVAVTIAADETCSICTDNFQKRPRKKPVECIFCNYRACVECQETYLLGSVQDAHCLNCKKSWNREFMASYFTNAFMTETYKKHREDILMARERSMLPQRMVVLDRMIRGEKMAEEIKPLQEEVQKLQLEFAKKQNILYKKIQTMGLLKGGIEPTSINIDGTKKQVELREFHKACPADDCRGFLSTQYKCGLCSIWVCPDCHEIKGADRDTEHTCKAENVESVKMKKKECRNCPECAAEIYKEIGCDQMWCTKCQTTFDWKTGKKLVNVKVHNPHYYEYLRQTKGSVPRDPDDNPCAAFGGRNQIDAHLLLRIGVNVITPKVTPGIAPSPPVTKLLCSKDIYNNIIKRGFISVLQLLNHVYDLNQYRYNNDFNDRTNEDVDIRYLRKAIDEKSWKQILQNREKNREKKQNINQILVTFTTIGYDILRALIHDYKEQAISKKPEGEIDAFLLEVWNNLEVLRGIVNKSFEKHAALYKCKAPHIEEKVYLLEYKTIWSY